MATQPPTLPAVTEEALLQYLRENADAAASESKKPEPPAPPQKMKATLGDQTFEFSTNEDLQNFFNAVQNQIAALVGQQQQTAKPEETKEKPEEFSQEKFAQLFLKDAREAFDYAGVGAFSEIEELKKQIEELKKQRTQEQVALAAKAFVASTSDYDANPQNLANMTEVLQQLQIPPSEMGLRAAWSYLKETGRAIVKKAPEKPQVQQAMQPLPQWQGAPLPQWQGTPVYGQPPLPTGGGSATAASTRSQIEQTIQNMLTADNFDAAKTREAINAYMRLLQQQAQ